MRQKLFWLGALGIAFGLVEAAVVVYLRTLCYPEGFELGVGGLPANLLRTETIREGATLVILAATGVLAGRTRLARFAAFITVFGVWDIFYYLWLRAFLGWPETLLEWDILFLIPSPWAAPVLAPLLVSLGFVGCGTWLFWREETGRRIRTTSMDWAVEIVAGGIIILSFLVNDGTALSEPAGAGVAFRWWLFGIGLAGGLGYFLWRALEGGEEQSPADPSEARSP
ncbi:MAG: hypothetical protein ACE5GH_01875 [Fidelibacterota bacterium]